MVLHHRANDGSPVWKQWHIARANARHLAMDIIEYSDIEVEQFDLDTAQLTGADNPRTFTTTPSQVGDRSNPYDVRDLPMH